MQQKKPAESASEVEAADTLQEVQRTGRGPRIVRSEDLFGPSREVRIQHQGDLYVLRLTRLGKLILNK